jgi:succinate dehydrogenase/fumarate reductase flavoprotein subunit
MRKISVYAVIFWYSATVQYGGKAYMTNSKSDSFELRPITVESVFFRAAMERKELRGWFIREDYPEMDNENWLKWIIVQDKNG